MSRGARLALRVTGLLATLWVAGLVTARLAYPKILFPAPRVTDRPRVGARVGSPDGPALVEVLHGGGKACVGFFLAPTGKPKGVVAWFHGNGETGADPAPFAKRLAARGVAVLLAEYRGYGICWNDLAGEAPTDDSLYEDGEAALRWLGTQGWEPAQAVVVGTSLGSSVAAELAARGHAKALVMTTPFASIPAMARHMMPIFPPSLVVAHRLDTLEKAPRIHVPTVVFHGTADEVVPFAQGQAVAGAIPGARFEVVEGARHNEVIARAGDALEASIVELATAR